MAETLGRPNRRGLLPGPARALRTALTAWEESAAGGVVVLSGPPGSGKTSILRALAEAVDESDLLVGSAWSKEVPLALLRQSRTLLTGPEVVSAGDLVDLAEALLDSLREGAQRLIAVDDVGMADAASLHVLGQVARRLAETRTTLLIALDPAEAEHLDPDFRRMLTDACDLEITIDDFDPADAAALARAEGIDVGDHGALLLAHRSGGRLRTASEILSLLPGGRWPSDPEDVPLPSAVVREVLEPIAEARAGEIEDVASALAILTGAQEVDRVMRMAGVADVEGTIDLGVTRGILTDHDAAGRPALRLAHPDAARVLRSTMTPSTRRYLHHRAAETAPDEDERLTHEAAAALGADPGLAARLAEAATAAERHGRWADAAGLHFGAARVLPVSAEREGQLLAGIDALASAGRVTEALPWIDLAGSLAATPRRDLVLANAAIHRGRAAQAEELLTHAAEGSEDLAAQVALRRTLDSLVRWDGPSISTWTQRAMALSDPQDPAHVESLVVRGLGFAAQGRLTDAEAELASLSGRRLGGAQDQRLRLCRGWVALLTGDHRTAVRELDAAVPTQRERGSLRISLWARGWLARTQYLLGEWDEALRTAETGLRLCEEANIGLLHPLLHWTAAEIRLWRGHPVDEVMRSAAGGAILSDYLAMQVPARLTRAVAADVRGDHDGRATALRPLTAADPWTPTRVSFWPWTGELVDALLGLGHGQRAAAHSVEFTAATAQASPLVRAQAATAEARVAWHEGRIAEAEAAFDRALALVDDGQHATEVARIHFARGQMLRRANRRREAAESLVRARELCEGVGAAVLLARCDRELRATGMAWRGLSQPSQATASAEGATSAHQPLTPQEQAVADLVIRGMTNAEVAGKLFIAEKTVQYHLTHIYAKLGIRSRTQLTALHLGEDLTDP